MRDGDGDNKNPNMEPSKGSYMTSNAVENAVQSCRIPSKAPMLAHKKYRQGKVEEKRDHEKKTQAWREELIWSCKNGGNGVAGCTWQGFADWFCFCGRAFARLLDRDEHRSSAGGREAWLHQSQGTRIEYRKSSIKNWLHYPHIVIYVSCSKTKGLALQCVHTTSSPRTAYNVNSNGVAVCIDVVRVDRFKRE